MTSSPGTLQMLHAGFASIAWSIALESTGLALAFWDEFPWKQKLYCPYKNIAKLLTHPSTKLDDHKVQFAQSAGTVEYTNCISTVG